MCVSLHVVAVLLISLLLIPAACRQFLSKAATTTIGHTTKKESAPGSIYLMAKALCVSPSLQPSGIQRRTKSLEERKSLA